MVSVVTVSDLRERLGLSPEDSDADAVILALIADAEAYARAFCRLKEEENVPDFLLAQMVSEDYGRMDGAGLSYRSVSGAAETYRSGYSDAVMHQLCAMRHPASLREGFR